MAEAQPQQPEYVSPLSVDSVLELTEHLKKAMSEFATAKGGRLDFFLIMASLGQLGYELAYNSLIRSEEDKQATQPEVEKIVNGLLAKLDGLRAEYKTRSASDLMATAQLMGVIAEIYCKRRDTVVLKTLTEQQNKPEGNIAE